MIEPGRRKDDQKDGQISIYDIARAAGVNPSTVSRALNNRDRIGTATRTKILRIAEDLGYQPSAIARSLTTRRTNTIGVVAPSLGDPYMAKVVDGIEQQAGDRDYRVLFSTSRRDSDRELTIANNFQRHRVDAVIIVATHFRTTYRLFETTLNVPVVLVGQEDPSSDIALVAVDDRAAIRDSVSHLITLGHRRLAFVGVDDRPFSNTVRARAFREAIGEFAPKATVTEIARSEETDLERGTASYLEIRDAGITAVQCYNDMVAVGLIGAALRSGLDVPGDLSVVGYDDLDISAYLPIPLTTVRQPREELGRKAVELVLAILEGGPRSRSFMTGHLVVRETTAPPKKL